MLKNQKGFTLVEMIAVLIILGIVISVSVHQFRSSSDLAVTTGVNLSITELNSRENLNWHNIKISDQGYIDDATMFSVIDYDLGTINWTSGPNVSGGTISVDGLNVVLTRSESTKITTAIWSK